MRQLQSQRYKNHADLQTKKKRKPSSSQLNVKMGWVQSYYQWTFWEFHAIEDDEAEEVANMQATWHP